MFEILVSATNTVSFVYNTCLISHPFHYGASVAKWLGRAVAVREVSSSNPSRGEHKDLCERSEPSDYVSFRRAAKRQRLHTLNTHDTKPKTTQQHSLQTLYTLELDLGPFPADADHFLPNDL